MTRLGWRTVLPRFLVAYATYTPARRCSPAISPKPEIAGILRLAAAVWKPRAAVSAADTGRSGPDSTSGPCHWGGRCIRPALDRIATRNEKSAPAPRFRASQHPGAPIDPDGIQCVGAMWSGSGPKTDQKAQKKATASLPLPETKSTGSIL